MWWSITILWAYVTNFMKICALVAEIFAKHYWRFFNPYFSMYFHKYSQSVKIKNLFKFFETIYQNVRISGEKGDLSNFIGCFLALVIRSKIISIQLDHPVSVRHPPTHQPTRTSIFESILDYLRSWNLVWKLYSTKLGQLAN